MPYSQSQLRCLQGMGLVPWVKRGSGNTEQVEQAFAAEEAVAQIIHEVSAADKTETPNTVATRTDGAPAAIPAAVAAPTSAPDFMQTPLVEIPFRGQRCSQLGKLDAPLLILVEAISTQQKQYPFEANDAKLFDDMLRSIAWRRQDVCLAVLPPSGHSLLLEDASSISEADNAGVPCVADLCKPHRDAVLMFRMSLPETLQAEELVVPMERKGMMAWQLPHPAMLRESPNRKRQAWNVLKAARQRLRPAG